MKTRIKLKDFILLLVCILCVAGCATNQARHNSASVVDFLYPDTKDPVVVPGIPVLTLPLKVGIAFVPSINNYDSTLTEQRKMELMNQIGNHFKQYPYVKDIEFIPTAYLRVKGGFSNLDQIRTMYGVDVIALVSYDQVQFTDQGVFSLAYWTIVGAYIVPGEKNDTHTMLDTVVVDINSRKMLFRAPGMGHVKGLATPINLSEQLRADSKTSFDNATTEMINNLDQQLATFKDKVKARPEEYKVVPTAEYRARAGGGDLDVIWLLMVAALGISFIVLRRKTWLA
jgi:rhombotail lipoprotein